MKDKPLKTMENRFAALSDEQLDIAFGEYEEWRKTGVLKDGIVRTVYDQFCADTGINAVIHLITEPLLYVIVKRLKAQ